MSPTIDDTKYMKRCLELAMLGEGNVSPNPMVGSVIVHGNKIIGEGYHKKAGTPHAEVNAICSVKNTHLLSQSTLYVNLEPCSHYGKTPPCADFIIEKNIPKVVIGRVDTSEKVCGKGIQKMQMAGIEVVVGVLEKECANLNKRFYTFHEKKRPYIILKWAETGDGFIDIERDNSQEQITWITNALSRVLVHKLRAEEDAILIGTQTALLDNPHLNVREWKGNNPLRIVLDNTLRLPQHLNVFDKSIPTLILNSKKNLQQINLEYIKIPFVNTEDEILEVLYKKNIQSVIIEGGAMLLNSFISKNLWDEALVFVGNVNFKKGVKAPVLNTSPYIIEKVDDCLLKKFINIV